MIRLQVLILLSLLAKVLPENEEVLEAGSIVEEPPRTVLEDKEESVPLDATDSDLNGISVSETATVEVSASPSAAASVGENTTLNVTVSQPRPVCEVGKGCRPRLQCLDFSSLNDSELVDVVGQRRAVIVSVNQLEYILENPGHVNGCVLVMFYGDWCPYSIEFAPVYNALGERFPDLLVVAVDYGAQEPNKFVLAYLPRVLIYYSGRAVFNIDTGIPLQELEDIVSNMTGMLPDYSQPEDKSNNADFQQFPTSRKEDRLFLIVCVLWLAFVVTVQLMRTGPCAALVSRIGSRLSTTTTKTD